MIDNNQTQAYLRAGYNCTPKSAESKSARLVRNGKVASRIAELRAELAKTCGITAQMVLERYKKIAFSCITDHVQVKDGNILLRDIAEGDRDRCISLASMKVNRKDREVIEIKMKDDLEALRDIGKHLGFFKEDNTLTHKLDEHTAEIIALIKPTRGLPSGDGQRQVNN